MRHALDVLVALHCRRRGRVPELAKLGRGDGYVARQVAGWTDRFARARTDDTGDWSRHHRLARRAPARRRRRSA